MQNPDTYIETHGNHAIGSGVLVVDRFCDQDIHQFLLPVQPLPPEVLVVLFLFFCVYF